jgi:spermidine/putrescine transport system ATP-binding protein
VRSNSVSADVRSNSVSADARSNSILVVEVPNARGPGSVTYQPGAAVTCVCTHDAVRVLHRSSARPISDPVIEDAVVLSPSSL